MLSFSLVPLPLSLSVCCPSVSLSCSCLGRLSLCLFMFLSVREWDDDDNEIVWTLVRCLLVSLSPLSLSRYAVRLSVSLLFVCRFVCLCSASMPAKTGENQIDVTVRVQNMMTTMMVTREVHHYSFVSVTLLLFIPLSVFRSVLLPFLHHHQSILQGWTPPIIPSVSWWTWSMTLFQFSLSSFLPSFSSSCIIILLSSEGYLLSWASHDENCQW